VSMAYKFSGRNEAGVTFIGRENPAHGGRIRATRTATSGPHAAGSATAYDGVHVFDPDGKRIGVSCYRKSSNVCFGGPNAIGYL